MQTFQGPVLTFSITKPNIKDITNRLSLPILAHAGGSLLTSSYKTWS